MAPHGWHDDGFPLGWTVRGALWRIAASIVAPVAWLCATLVYLGFWAHGLSAFQVVVVCVVSGLTLLGTLLVMWLSFGVSAYRRWVDA